MVVKYLKLKDIKAYVIASDLSDDVWELVIKWDWFAKKALGAQWCESTDSIASNIAEGFGRFHKKDKQKFYYNSRASVYESAHWCKKSFKRKLITAKEKEHVLGQLRILPKEINSLIQFTEKRLKK
jgi:four helix bundle protein